MVQPATYRNVLGLSFPWIDFFPRAGGSADHNKPYAQTYETEKENLKYLKHYLYNEMACAHEESKDVIPQCSENKNNTQTTEINPKRFPVCNSAVLSSCLYGK